MTQVHVPGFIDAPGNRARLARSLERKLGAGAEPGRFDPASEMLEIVQRPAAKRWNLDASFKASQIDALAQKARERGFDLLEVDVDDRYAIVGALDPHTRSVRKRLASNLKARPHEVEIIVSFDDAGMPELVQITRAPEVGSDPEKRIQRWREAMLTIPGAHRDWIVQDDIVSGRVTFAKREPISLPQTVALEDITPERLSPEDWAKVDLGLDGEGNRIGIDLRLGPHAMLVGPTGSGKTVGVLALAASDILHGHDVAIIDPTKGGVDFSSIDPYCIGFAESYEESVALIAAIYDEGTRRKGLLKKHMEVKWSDLPQEIRDAENVRPLTLIIDEVSSLLLIPPVPKGLDKDDPLVVEANELATQKSLLSSYIGKIARELRFVGIHLILAMQRPDAAILSGELRSNLTSVVQLTKPGTLPSLDAIRMAFPGDLAAEAADTLRQLDDGRSPGLGVIAGDGGKLAAVRVAFAPMKSLPEILDARGARRVDKWALADNAQRLGRRPDQEDPFGDPFADDPFADVFEAAPAPVTFDLPEPDPRAVAPLRDEDFGTTEEEEDIFAAN